MKARLLFVLLASASSAMAQTPAPASQPATQPQSQDAPPPKKPLNLSLDPADQPRTGRITFEPRDDKKPQAEQTLPGMGGERTRAWEPPSDKIFPPDTNPGMR